jgi:hypothetical protein
MISLADQIIYSTVRIEAVSEEEEGSGTGFFASFCRNKDFNKDISAIVTNKHVIRDCTIINLYINIQHESRYGPDLGRHIKIPICGFENVIVYHPDPMVDLVVIPFAPIDSALKDAGKQPFFTKFDSELWAYGDFVQNLSALEDIVMIGYPNGLWDSKNNMPIMRKGITATAPYIDFEGKSQFLIDCACFKGSSGSPVFLYNQGGYTTKDGRLEVGFRFKLLGILSGAHHFPAEGDIFPAGVSFPADGAVLSQIPMNLGSCEKAENLLWFENYFRPKMNSEISTWDRDQIGEPEIIKT